MKAKTAGVVAAAVMAGLGLAAVAREAKEKKAVKHKDNKETKEHH